MTIIVWDGHSLSTDRAATDGQAKWKTTKAWRWGDKILSGAGPLQSILAMREWYKEGADPKNFPLEQLSLPCHFIVVTKEGGLIRYETGPIPIEHGRAQCAFGEGRDFAYGAMAMGADSEQAVMIANTFSIHCGQGVQTFTLEE